MWHTNPNAMASQNPPSVIKNFNAYDLLEPEKVAPPSSAILVDVSENTSDLNLDLHGSYLDRVKKSDFDLLDLYQNIYVTPQEVQKEPRENHSTRNKNADADHKIDFTEFFEKAEQGLKLSEPAKHNSNVDDILHIPQIGLIRNSRNFDETLDLAISSTCSKLSLEPPAKSNSMCKDKIDAVYLPKLVIDPSVFKERRPTAISNLNNGSTAVYDHNILDKRKIVLKPSELNNTDNKKVLNTTNMNPEQLGSDKSNYRDVRMQQSFALPVYYKHNAASTSKIEPQFDIAPEQTRCLADISGPSFNHSGQNIPIIQTVKLNHKLYSKRRFVKTAAEKVGFTKGPDIHEKSVVLPQVMKRLTARKLALEEHQVQRTLVSDTTKVTNERCNFYDKNGLVNTHKHIMVTQKTLNDPSNNKDAHFISKDLSNIKGSHFLTEELLRQLKPTKPLKKQESEMLQKSMNQIPIPVKLEPVILREDCYRNRMKEVEARVAFEKFVNTGE